MSRRQVKIGQPVVVRGPRPHSLGACFENLKRKPGALQVVAGGQTCLAAANHHGIQHRQWQPQVELSVMPVVPQHDSFADASQQVVCAASEQHALA